MATENGKTTPKLQKTTLERLVSYRLAAGRQLEPRLVYACTVATAACTLNVATAAFIFASNMELASTSHFFNLRQVKIGGSNLAGCQKSETYGTYLPRGKVSAILSQVGGTKTGLGEKRRSETKPVPTEGLRVLSESAQFKSKV